MLVLVLVFVLVVLGWVLVVVTVQFTWGEGGGSFGGKEQQRVMLACKHIKRKKG